MGLERLWRDKQQRLEPVAPRFASQEPVADQVFVRSMLAKSDDEKLADLMERLIAEGVKMYSFADREPTLEDVFMMVTKGLVT